jgi:multidrug efflux pump subunit AcrA (membrane-fusion protein)
MTSRHFFLFAGGLLLALGIGWFGRGLLSHDAEMDRAPSASSEGGSCPNGADPLYWKAPMDPSYVRATPGKSPMGMDMVPVCPSAAGAAPDGAVVVDSATMQNIGIRTAPVERKDLARAVRAVGRVAYDERRVVHVHTKVQGWIEELRVDFVGQEVKRGEPLLEIYSPELVATQEELLLAARYRDATGESPFEDVRGGGVSLFEATKRRLALWDIPERDVKRLLETGDVKRTLTLYAPASGVITRLGVRSGMEVRPNANLYTIADLSTVWVLADVYEYELPWLALGQTASVELSYLHGESMEGELTYIAPFLDPETRTVEVRLELDNSAGKLKPEMFGNAVIAGTPHLDALAIPTESVIHSGTRTIAVVSLGGGRFEPRDIQIGLNSGDGWLEVLDGLAEGEDVVISSQFLIDSESNLQEAVKSLLAARSAASAGEPPPSTASPEGHLMPAADEARPMDQTGHDMSAEHEMRGGTESKPTVHEGQSMSTDHEMPTSDSAPTPEHDHSSMGKE